MEDRPSGSALRGAIACIWMNRDFVNELIHIVYVNGMNKNGFRSGGLIPRPYRVSEHGCLNFFLGIISENAWRAEKRSRKFACGNIFQKWIKLNIPA